MTTLIAGHETSAAVLTWTLFELTRHPEVGRYVYVGMYVCMYVWLISMVTDSLLLHIHPCHLIYRILYPPPRRIHPSTYKQALAKVREEVDLVLGDRIPTYDDVKGLLVGTYIHNRYTYIHACLDSREADIHPSNHPTIQPFTHPSTAGSVGINRSLATIPRTTDPDPSGFRRRSITGRWIRH